MSDVTFHSPATLDEAFALMREQPARAALHDLIHQSRIGLRVRVDRERTLEQRHGSGVQHVAHILRRKAGTRTCVSAFEDEPEAVTSEHPVPRELAHVAAGDLSKIGIDIRRRDGMPHSVAVLVLEEMLAGQVLTGLDDLGVMDLEVVQDQEDLPLGITNQALHEVDQNLRIHGAVEKPEPYLALVSDGGNEIDRRSSRIEPEDGGDALR